MTDSGTPFLFERYADDYDRLFLAEVDGVVWASNSYWAVPVPDDHHPIAKLLALYNLPLAPCALWSGETLTVDTDTASEKRLAALTKLVQLVPDDLAPLARYCLHDEPLYGYDGERALALYGLPSGRFVALNDRYRQLVEDDSHGEWWGGPDPMKPVYLRHEGKTTGMVMGVRCRLSEYVPTTELVTTGAA